MMSRATRCAIASLCVLVLPGCGPPPALWVPVERFASGPDAAEPARAVITGDLRPVLRAFPAVRIHQGHVGPRPQRPARLELAVAPSLADAKRLVLTPFVKRRNAEGYYRPLASRLVPVRGSGRDARVALPTRLAPGPLDLYVEARRVPAEPVQRVETRRLEIPPDGRLDFAIGILEPAWEQGPVRFEISACDDAGVCSGLFAETLDPRLPDRGAWRERRLPLGALAGAQRSLRFETRFAEGTAGGFSLPLWADPVLLAPRARSDDDRSLILVSLDTLRADHLEAYGYARDTAPFLSGQLAGEGTLFEAAVSAATTTAPSHMTMFTSLQPSVHAVRGNTGAVELPLSAPTLAERLRAQGFATAAVTEGAGVAPRRGFERGFGRYVERRTRIPHEPGTQSALTFPEGLDWIRRVGDRRFFLFLHTYEVHGPYRPPAAYQSLFADTPPGLEPRPGLPPRQRPVLYDREIRYVDDELRRFVEGLEAAGRLDDTLLVVTSDHGEEFLEHGIIGHGAAPYEEVLRVPLLFRGPGVPAGRRVEAPVGLVDLMPTLLDLLGVPVPVAPMGRSFAGLLRGPADHERWRRRPIYSEAWFRWANTAAGRRRVEQPTLAVRVGERKLIRFREAGGFRYELYDLAQDPREQRDLYPAQGASASELRELLDAYEQDALARRRALLRGDPREAPALDPDREQGLRALGYLE